jgi:hypothetical protein
MSRLLIAVSASSASISNHFLFCDANYILDPCLTASLLTLMLRPKSLLSTNLSGHT